MGPGDHLELIDGSGFIFRAYHALPPLTRKSDGLPVGAVAGFCNMLHKLIEARQSNASGAPTHAAVILDHSAKSFRNEIYDDYKAHRPPPPEDLVPQFPLIRDATRAFNLPCIELEGFEADDIIATYARLASEAGARVTIVSSDKDLMQLVSDAVQMCKPGLKGGPDEIIDPAGVREKFGVGPDRVVDVQALAGDSIDNVPGAPGIGIKTAAQLINDFGDLETLLSRAEEIKQPKRRQTLIDFAEQIRVSRRLVELCTTVPDLAPLDDLALRLPEPETLLGFLRLMEFRTLTSRIADRLGVESLPPPPRPKAPPPKPRPQSPSPTGRTRPRPRPSTSPPTRSSAPPKTCACGSPGSRTAAPSPSTPRPTASTRCAPISSASPSPPPPARPPTSPSPTSRATATSSAAPNPRKARWTARRPSPSSAPS